MAKSTTKTKKKAANRKPPQSPKRGSRKGGTIKTTCRIHSLTVGIHEDRVSFGALSVDAQSHGLLTKLVRQGAEIILGLELPGKPDKDFPRIEQKVKFKSYAIKKSVDTPDIVNLVFSTGQIAQLVNYIRAEQELTITITQLQGQLFDDPPEEKTTPINGMAATVAATENKTGKGAGDKS
jgi:hypothetical protein